MVSAFVVFQTAGMSSYTSTFVPINLLWDWRCYSDATRGASRSVAKRERRIRRDFHIVMMALSFACMCVGYGMLVLNSGINGINGFILLNDDDARLAHYYTGYLTLFMVVVQASFGQVKYLQAAARRIVLDGGGGEGGEGGEGGDAATTTTTTTTTTSSSSSSCCSCASVCESCSVLVRFHNAIGPVVYCLGMTCVVLGCTAEYATFRSCESSGNMENISVDAEEAILDAIESGGAMPPPPPGTSI